jgi:hypothetical protein
MSAAATTGLATPVGTVSILTPTPTTREDQTVPGSAPLRSAPASIGQIGVPSGSPVSYKTSYHAHRGRAIGALPRYACTRLAREIPSGERSRSGMSSAGAQEASVTVAAKRRLWCLRRPTLPIRRQCSTYTGSNPKGVDLGWGWRSGSPEPRGLTRGGRSGSPHLLSHHVEYRMFRT